LAALAALIGGGERHLNTEHVGRGRALPLPMRSTSGAGYELSFQPRWGVLLAAKPGALA